MPRFHDDEDDRSHSTRWWGILISGIAVGVVALTAGAVVGFGYVAGLDKASGGEVIVVRNGGMFDDNSFRQIITTADGLTSTGLWSESHPYPITQRYYKIGPGGDSDKQITVPSKDGVNITIEGTYYFELNTDPAVLEAFDDAYGTRTFPIQIEDKVYQVPAWDTENNGWSAFLDATMGNLVESSLRQEIGRVTCTQLVASCALAQNAPTGDTPTTVSVDPNAPDTGNTTLTTIQDGVNTRFAANVEAQLGLPLFTNIKFVASKVNLPDNVQNAINVAQQSVADANGRVATAQAGQAEALALAEQNAARQNGYIACPACAEIDILKALPQGITVYAPGNPAGLAVAVPAPAPQG